MDVLSLLSGVVVEVTTDAVTIDVGEVLVDSGFTGGTLEIPGGWLDVEVGDAALALVEGNSLLPSAAFYSTDPYQLRTPTDMSELYGYLGQADVLDALWYITQPWTCGFVPTGPASYDTPVDAVVGYLNKTTPFQQYRAWTDVQLELDRRAGAIADGAEAGTDAVSGESTFVDERAVRRQFEAGVPDEAIALPMLVPVFFDSRELSASTQVALIDASSGWLLFTIELHPGMRSGDRYYGIGLSGAPAAGNAVQVVVYDDHTILAGCYSDELAVSQIVSHGTVLNEIAYDNFAGTKRAFIDVASGTVTGLDGDGLANMEAAEASD